MGILIVNRACGSSSTIDTFFWPVVHENKIFEDLTKFSLFCPLLGPKRGQPLYLNKSESSSPQSCFPPRLVELARWFLRRSRLKKKVHRRTDGQIAIAIYHLRLRWAKNTALHYRITNKALKWIDQPTHLKLKKRFYWSTETHPQFTSWWRHQRIRGGWSEVTDVFFLIYHILSAK